MSPFSTPPPVGDNHHLQRHALHRSLTLTSHKQASSLSVSKSFLLPTTSSPTTVKVTPSTTLLKVDSVFLKLPTPVPVIFKFLRSSWRRPQDFCTKPKVDLRSINNAMFFHPSKDNQAYLFAKFLKDQCEKDFPVMRTAKGRRFVSKCIIDLKTKKYWVYYKYPPPLTEEAVPVSPRAPDNSLANFMSWYFDEKTLSAVILRNKDDINDIGMILDPMDLLKFGKEDLMKLRQSPIKVYGGWDEEAKPYTHTVAYAIELKLYAGAGPHKFTLSIG
ncbi:hypothetical protein R6Q59_035569 [Mikania micrantha]